jgi:hypothetical protein
MIKRELLYSDLKKLSLQHEYRETVAWYIMGNCLTYHHFTCGSRMFESLDVAYNI